MTAHCEHCRGGIAPDQPLMVEYRDWDGGSRLDLVGPHELPSADGVVASYHLECHDLRLRELVERTAALDGDVTDRCAVCLEDLQTSEPITVSYWWPEDDRRTTEVIGPFDTPSEAASIEAAFHMACWGTRMRGAI